MIEFENVLYIIFVHKNEIIENIYTHINNLSLTKIASNTQLFRKLFMWQWLTIQKYENTI